MILGKHITIKILEKQHLENLRLLRNHPSTSFYLTSALPINETMQQQWYMDVASDPAKLYWAIEKKGIFVGMVRMDEWDKINRSIRIGVDIVPEYRRQNIAWETYQLILLYLFDNLSVNRVWLLVLDNNHAAIVLYNKLGFKEEGRQRQAIFRQGKFHDYIMMSLLKTEYGKNSRK